MSENITFAVSGSETYYHKDWLKSKGFKWVASSKKWEKLNILEIEADQLSEYCREFGLYYERSDKVCQNLIMRVTYGMAIFQINLFGMRKRVFQIQQTKKISELKLKIFHKKRKSKLLLKQNNTVLCFCS